MAETKKSLEISEELYQRLLELKEEKGTIGDFLERLIENLDKVEKLELEIEELQEEIDDLKEENDEEI